MSSLDKGRLQQEMSTLPLSTISTSIAASSTSTAAAASSTNTVSYTLSSSTSTSNPGFLGGVITDAVNEVLSSTTNYTS
ncbi:hypothetical protein SPBR_05429 [Sporothrix brasiliensis 5110]|uniref:Uncharacterized protein n=1 Tax=Sporothrix brasiliensis 5110 TaxID=1398154 RepID=A0A0C2IE84_9PEZI|nr:uncharacterized protein SPBR_05429 [Sporothrix brasiliensis 5110]KIH87571.1 hypothetical protein SPBR_05429 [Sporothrix brasiliensis 5110]